MSPLRLLRRLRPWSLVAGALVMGILAGCSSRRAPHASSHVVYAIPDDFRLSMLRFQRRLEAGDIEGTLRSFDPLAFPHYRDLERDYLEFARRAADIHWEWKITDIKEHDGFRVFEVPWHLTFDDVLHGHRVSRRGVTDIRWSHHVVPRIVGMERDRIFQAK